MDNQVTVFDPRMAMSSGMSTPGLQTPMDNIDMQRIGKARTLLMDSQLGKVSDSVTGQTVIDPKGYLTDLQSMLPQMSINPSGSEIADIKKSRLLLKSIIETNPKKVSGWIAIVRFEEHFSKIHEAKQLVMKGCDNCPDSEEMWLEAIRIMKQYGGSDNVAHAKSVAAKAIRHVSNSVSLWVAAANLEDSAKAKRVVYRKALQVIPDSVKLWKLTVELEDDLNEARQLLEGAVLCCPTSVELWLALAKLNNPTDARSVLNTARQKIPNDRQIWITACKLEEAEGNEDKIELLIKRAIEVLKSNMVEINRDEWIKDAEEAEKSGSKVTAQKIIQKVVSIGVDEQDKKHTWIADAESCEEHGFYECARAIYSVAIAQLPNKKGIWKRAAAFEKEHGSRESYEDVLGKAVENCPNVEVLWLMAAKSKWEAGDVENARNILSKAFAASPNSEEIMLAAVKLESENNEFDRANRLLQRARTNVGTNRVWMKSARLEWCLGRFEAAEQLLLEAVEQFPKYPKLWMMLGQVREQRDDADGALNSYKEGSLKNPDSIPLWTLQAGLEERQGSVSKARNTLEKAKARNIKVPELWLASIRLELRASNAELANNLMSRALQHCPSSGLLWAESISIVPKKNRLIKAKDALLKCEHSEHVLLAAAKVFWEHGFEKKAREWLTKTVKVEKLFGDAWAYLYKLDTIYGSEAQREEIMTRCVLAEPRFGEYWCPISKDVANWKLKTRDILPIVAARLPLPI